MLSKVIITNNIKFLKKSLASSGQDIAYYIMEGAGSHGLIRDYLSSRSGCFEFNNGNNIMEEDVFIKKYSDFIYRLNTANADILWWTMNFTNKNPLLTGLYHNVYEYLKLIRLIKNSPADVLVIVSSNKHLLAQSRRWISGKGIDAAFFVSEKTELKQWLLNVPLLLTVYAFAKVLLRKTLSYLFIRPIKMPLEKEYIIATQFENKSFDIRGGFYDTYFGRLKEFLKKENKSYLVCGYTNCAFKDIIKNSFWGNREDAIYPFEYFMSFPHILRCAAESFFFFFVRLPKARRDIEIDGENVSVLIEEEAAIANNSGQVFVNLSVFYCLKSFLREASVKKLFYPFENRSWEKMILLAARNAPRGIKLIGYQHASLTLRHANFIMEDSEPVRIPFPDEIIATGDIARNILVDIFNFPAHLVKAGCALRQTLPQAKVLMGNGVKKNNRILLALASSIDEYVALLRFLDLAFDVSLPYHLVIRPHPALDFNQALKIYCPRNLRYELDKFSLYESLDISDIILYTSSTVSLEAVSLGIPVINIPIEGVLNSDPLFNMPYLKWVCANPKELGKTITDIFKVDDAALRCMRDKARQFTESYFTGANEKTIGVFL